MRHRWPYALSCAPLAMYLACTAGGGSSFEGGRDNGSGGTSGTESNGASTDDVFNPQTTSGSGENGCFNDANVDDDNDGFTEGDGDCNDCDANVNPGAIEVATPMGSGSGGAGGAGGAPEPADENCDMQIDEAPVVCDANLALNDTSPLSAAQSLGLCNQTTPTDKTFGVLAANWMRANGTPAMPYPNSASIQDGWGPNVPVREGGRMLVLSSGHAKLPNQPGACGTLSCYTSGPGTPPPNFPANVPGCSGSPNINDDVALEVQLRAPTNATGYSFDFTFYSFEFPEWVCTSYNDQFIALVNPPPMGSIDGNISFDSMNNPVSVNIAFFEVCNYDPFYPQFPCALGPGELQGTGFDVWDDAGATSWLVTTAPVTGGEEFTIRFAIWDTGDQAWDSTVVIDNFKWIAESGTNVEVGTTPVPE